MAGAAGRTAPHNLVFVDETGASTKIIRLDGRCPRGERLVAPVPWGHWKTTTFVGALRQDASLRLARSTGRSTARSLRLGRAVPRSRAQARRHRHPGQSVGPQGRGRQNGDPKRSRPSAPPPGPQPRSQPDRAMVRQAAGAPAQSRGANLRRPRSAPSPARSLAAHLDECANYLANSGYQRRE